MRHFVSSQITLYPAALPCSDVERFILEHQNEKHYISAFYSTLSSGDRYELLNISCKWERDLSTEYIEDDWQMTISLIRTTFTCNRLRETQYKILHRPHITPVILYKMDRSLSPLCIKCTVQTKSLDTPSHSMSFLYFHDYENCRFTLKASKL